MLFTTQTGVTIGVDDSAPPQGTDRAFETVEEHRLRTQVPIQQGRKHIT
jgi:hypothetical protein